MRDEDAAFQQSRIDMLLDKWVPLCGLENWDMRHFYHRDAPVHGEDGSLTQAAVTPHWAYMEARFEWNLAMAESNDDASLEEVVVHELCHCLVDETAGGGDNEERVVTMLARAFCRVDRQTEVIGG